MGQRAYPSGFVVAPSHPLSGIRVLDLTRLLPGAYATLMLADFGADIIKVEDPRGGDHARRLPPLVNGTSAYFTVLNRNKRSLTLNLRAPAAGRVLDALIPRCDVVIHSFRPKTAVRLGVDREAVRRRNERIVYASITGFGETGPYADLAAHDINYEALAGLLTLSGGQPQVPGLLVGDIGAAFQTVSGVLAALLLRERTQMAAGVVDVSIHDAALQWMQFPSAPELVGRTVEPDDRPGRGVEAPRDSDVDPRRVPLRGEAGRYNVYECADGKWVALGALEEKFWVAFCDRIGRLDLAPLQDVRGEEQTRVLAEVRALMRTRTRDEWLEHFAGVDVCLTPVHSLREALADPHVASRGTVRHHAGVTYIGAQVDVRPAPALGADTDDVLGAIGVGEDERANLRASGVI